MSIHESSSQGDRSLGEYRRMNTTDSIHVDHLSDLHLRDSLDSNRVSKSFVRSMISGVPSKIHAKFDLLREEELRKSRLYQAYRALIHVFTPLGLSLCIILHLLLFMLGIWITTYTSIIVKLLPTCTFDPQIDPWGCGWNWNYLVDFFFLVVNTVAFAVGVAAVSRATDSLLVILKSLVRLQLYLSLSKSLATFISMLNYWTANDLQRLYLRSENSFYIMFGIRMIMLFENMIAVLLVNAREYAEKGDLNKLFNEEYEDYDLVESDWTVDLEGEEGEEEKEEEGGQPHVTVTQPAVGKFANLEHKISFDAY